MTKMQNTCPYEKNVICNYMDLSRRVSEITGEPIIHHCGECPHYSPRPDEEHRDPIGGTQTIGCLLTGIVILLAILFLAGSLIKYLRKNETSHYPTEQTR